MTCDEYDLCEYNYELDDCSSDEDGRQSDSHTLSFLQDPSGRLCGGVGATVWDSGLVLMKYLETQRKHAQTSKLPANLSADIMDKDHRRMPGIGWIPGRWQRILELGSGVGLCGLVLDRLLKDNNDLQNNRQLVLSDKDCALPLLQHNLDNYLQRKNSPHCNISLRSLDWSETASRTPQEEKFDLIIASDCVHWPELFQPLVDTLFAYSHPLTEVLLSYERRDFSGEVEFFKIFGERFCFYSVSSLQEQMHPNWQSPEDIYVFRARLRKEGE